MGIMVIQALIGVGLVVVLVGERTLKEETEIQQLVGIQQILPFIPQTVEKKQT
jgi:hypothetical protein